jgi:hypothetical protein
VISLGEQPHNPNGCHLAGWPHLGPCRDRSREAGRALTEIRTVLSRAATARLMLVTNCVAGPQSPLERPRLPKPETTLPGMVDAGEPPYDLDGEPFDDPDHALMVTALDQVRAILQPWRRGPGKTTHWVADAGPTQLVVSPAPVTYTDEVGDEMFMGEQAVLAELRARLAAHFTHDPATARTVLGIADEYMRELVDQEREGEDDDEECGAVWVDPGGGRPPSQPCTKRLGHEREQGTDWKSGFHSNGTTKWPVGIAGDSHAGHECRVHSDAADCDSTCNPHWCVRPGGQGDVPTPQGDQEQ